MTDRRILVRLKEEVFRLFQDGAEIADRLAESTLAEQLAGFGEFLERGAVGRHEDVLTGVVGRGSRVSPFGCRHGRLADRPSRRMIT